MEIENLSIPIKDIDTKKKKTVTFDETRNQILPTWGLEYSDSRKGLWEQYARDKDRFNKRIFNEFEPILAEILMPRHRKKILQQMNIL